MCYFEVSTVLAASPARVYSAWLDSRELSEFIGGKAHVEAAPGGKFSARDGYIQGHFLNLTPYRQIVQNWRTADLPCSCADSLVALLLQPEGCCGTRLTVQHAQVPANLEKDYKRAWLEDYLEPMRRYFAEG
jgi:uncharacterized protein YndB with AHSA1/START domain